jgi:broad specificity phosphatase PhoE
MFRIQTLVFVRHGFTDWNIDGRFQGQLDIPLNATGRAQAQMLRDHLATQTFDRIYTSPLQRAAETARIVAGERMVLTDWRIAEIHHGDWQGKTRQEIASRWPEAWEQWNKTPLQVTSRGGESPELIRHRVQDFLRSVAGETVLCVSHGVVIQTVRSILLGSTHSEDRRSAPENASVHTFCLRHNQMTQYHCSGGL